MSEIIRPKIFLPFPELLCGISLKKLGNLKLTKRSNKNQVISNQKKMAKILSIEVSQIVIAELKHNAKVCLVKEVPKQNIVKNCDSLITKNFGIFLMVTIADCLPLFIYDHIDKVCAIVHAGWRSLTQGIIDNTLSAIVENFNSDPKNFSVYIGPGISTCHFEVKNDVAKLFSKDFIKQRDEKIFIDLKSFAKSRLLSAGVKKENIEVSSDCTFCQKDKYFSYRRDHSKEIEAMGAVIGIK